MYPCKETGCTRTYDSEDELKLHRVGAPGYQPHSGNVNTNWKADLAKL